MGVYYCNVDKITSILNSIKLDNWSIKEVFEFMCNEDGDTEKYIIKMFLLPLLETHLYINRIKNAFELFSGKEVSNADVSFEIINRQEQKPFWDWLLLEKTHDKASFCSWYFDGFSKYYYYFISPVKLKYDKIPESFLDRVKEERELLKDLKNKLKVCGITIRRFNELIKVASERVKINVEIDKTNEDFVSYVSIYIENFMERANVIDALGKDLIMNLMMLRDVCNSGLFAEKDLQVILKEIRKQFKRNSKNSGYALCFPCESDQYLDVYRDFEIKYEGEFWGNTTPFEDIPCDMNELFENFSIIYEIEDDSEYAVKCFELCQKLLQIHPYRNGNGRTSKYLLFLLLIRRGILPIAITDNHDLTSCYEAYFNSVNYFLGRMEMAGRRTGLK